MYTTISISSPISISFLILIPAIARSGDQNAETFELQWIGYGIANIREFELFVASECILALDECPTTAFG